MAVTPRILFAILNDHRYYNGRFLSYNEFITQKETEGNTSKKEANREWKKMEKDSFYDNLDISPEDIKPNQRFFDKYENQELALQEFEKVRLKIVNKTKQVTQLADGVLNDADRVAAQRDVLTNMFMMHRGWLLIALSKRFKKGGYSLATGQMEEGSYVTAYNAMVELSKVAIGKGSYKEWMESQDPSQKRNMKRVAIETALFGALFFLGKAMMEGDDEDDTWAEDLAQITMLRTFSEVSSSQLFGLPGAVVEVGKSPITIMKTLEAMYPINWITEFDEYDQEGNNKLWKSIVKATPLKRFGQYSDLQTTIDNFIFYNRPTLLGIADKPDAATEIGSESSIIRGN
jgi:hypothetical protein